MAIPSLKLPSNPFHPPEPPASPHTRQASLNIARSPLIAPSSTAYIPSVPSAPFIPTRSHGRKASYVPSHGLERTSEEAPPLKSRSSDEGLCSGAAAEGEELSRDLEAFDLMLDQGRQGHESGTDEEPRYEGPFQPPVGNEAVVIWASIVGVVVLAVAAGFTTVYDWVL